MGMNRLSIFIASVGMMNFFHDMGVKKICDISYRENMYKGYYNPCYYGQLPDRFWVDMDPSGHFPL